MLIFGIITLSLFVISIISIYGGLLYEMITDNDLSENYYRINISMLITSAILIFVLIVVVHIVNLCNCN